MSALSVVIVNWNTRDLLAACLAALGCDEPTWDHAVCVVDNASTDGSLAMLRERFPRVHVIASNLNIGFGPANNLGIRACGAHGPQDYVLLLNPDTEVNTGAIETMISFLDAHPEAGLCAPMLVNPDDSFQASYASFPTLLSEFMSITRLSRWLIGPYAPSPRPERDTSPRRVDWVAGAAMLARASAIYTAGLFDERYPLYSEETRLCWQMRETGFDVWYLPQVRVTHVGGASTRQRAAESYAQLYVSKVRFFEDAYGKSAALRLRALLRLTARARLALWQFAGVTLRASPSAERFALRMRQEMALLRVL